ncbi:MAG: glucosyltransferase domain-containing protein [Lachnospiraceae bacterium]|nr:glucosyltransferase domain-containing protein [Lachnospiraceae bacterium]
MKDKILDFLRKWYRVFIVEVVAGCTAYSLLMTNQLVNQLDGIWHGSISYASAHEVGIGRWLWPVLDKARGYLSPDPVTSFISISLFAAAFILVMDALEIRNVPGRYLGSIIFIINTGILAALSYRYMSPTFAASCFLAVLSGFILVKTCNGEKKYRAAAVCMSGLLISFMMGLYQANLGCVCLIVLFYVMRRLCEKDTTLRELGRLILESLAALIVGAVVYYIMVNISLKYYDTSLSGYGGAENYGPVETALHLFTRLPSAYGYFVDYYRNTSIKISYFSGKLYAAVYVLIAIVLIYTFFRLLKEDKIRAVLFAVTVILVPAAVNVIYFIAYEATPQIQMTIPVSMCVPLLGCICLDSVEGIMQKWYRPVLILFMGIVLYGNYIMTIYDQQAMYMGMNSLKELGSEIVAELIRDDLYHPYYKYVFVGKPSDSPVFAKNEVIFNRANRNAAVGTWTPDDLRWVTQSWQGFWEHEMGNRLQVAGDEALNTALEDEYVRNMPVFPEKGSCALVNDVVVVKLAPVE